MSRTPSKQNSNAWAISDRSGFKFRMKEMVWDDGILVHKSESDGQWSNLKHPQGNLTKYLKGRLGDPQPSKRINPDKSWVVDDFLTDEDGNLVTGIDGLEIYAIDNTDNELED